MMYENASYVFDLVTNSVQAIRVDINGLTACVPLDPLNTDYQNIMALVESGELTIAPATEVTDEQ